MYVVLVLLVIARVCIHMCVSHNQCVCSMYGWVQQQASLPEEASDV